MHFGMRLNAAFFPKAMTHIPDLAVAVERGHPLDSPFQPDAPAPSGYQTICDRCDSPAQAAHQPFCLTVRSARVPSAESLLARKLGRVNGDSLSKYARGFC